MGVLIDNLIKMKSGDQALSKFDDGWFMARPIGFHFGLLRRPKLVWWPRIKDAWRILNGKSFAVYFRETER